jgi:bifunctional DNA-binding transcriptional regulator/antitoxin component of YhaV-PrlF toxin-antitoxin module
MTERVIKLSEINEPMTPLVKALVEHPCATIFVANGFPYFSQHTAGYMHDKPSRRLGNRLKQADIVFVAQLAEISEKELSELKGLGKHSLREAREILLENELVLGKPLLEKSLIELLGSKDSVMEALNTARLIRERFGIKPGQACRILDEKEYTPAQLVRIARAEVTKLVAERTGKHSVAIRRHHWQRLGTRQRAKLED